MTDEQLMWITTTAWGMASSRRVAGSESHENEIRAFRMYYWALMDAMSEKPEPKKQ